MDKKIGQFEVTDEGIERVINVADYPGSYDTQIIIPKETFIEAYCKYMQDIEKTKREKEIAKAILEMGFDRTNYDKNEVDHVICKAIKAFLKV